MKPAESRELSQDQSRLVVDAVREELARRRMSRQRLADEARISISTLEKALNGSRPFTLATLVRLETALGMALRPAALGALSAQGEQPIVAAPPALGAYSRAAVRWLEGNYLTLRPSFEAKDTIYAYRTEIRWEASAEYLTFQESERLDAPFSQNGVVSVPSKSGHIYLHTNEEGQMRLAILGRPLITGQMYGLLTTLLIGSGTHLLPVAVPICLIPFSDAAGIVFGRVSRSDRSFQRYSDHLNGVLLQGYARLIAPPGRVELER